MKSGLLCVENGLFGSRRTIPGAYRIYSFVFFEAFGCLPLFLRL